MQTENKVSSQKFSNRLPVTWLVVIVLALSGCNSEGLQKSMEAERNAFGKINQVNVLCDQALWDGPLGDSLRYYYGAAYPILPQPEPIFDLRHLTLEQLRQDPLRKELRTYLIVGDLADEQSETSALIRQDVGKEKIRTLAAENGYGNSVAKNKWARGQTLVYLYGLTEAKLLKNITSSFPAVAKRLHQADERLIEATTYFSGEDLTLSEEVRAKMGVSIRLPEAFYTALADEKVMWLRRETSEISANILINKVPYTDQSQLTREGIKAIRNEIGKEYVSSSIANTYMRINDVDLPLFVETTRINGDYALEARGIWDIVNDFMGGAFVSYLIYDPAKPDLLFIDAFVHAPGKEKRDLMQEMEYILHTAKY